MKWKGLLTFIVSVILLLPFEQWVHACADMDPNDEYPTFFLNDVANSAAYRPFYYTGYYRYYQDTYEDGNIDYHLPCTNIVEWQAYSDRSLPLADIDSFVYSYTYDEVASLYNHIEKGTSLNGPKDVKENAFSRWFMKNKDLEALGYLLYAKQCEPNVQALGGQYEKDTYKWIEDKRDVGMMDKLRKNGSQLMAAAKNKSIQLRYAYQVIRLALYSDNYKETLRLCDELLKGRESESIIYARCLSLKAGAMYKAGRNDEAAYLYSKIFDLRDELKASTYVSFEWSTKGNIAGALKLCANDHERAVLYVMRGLHIYEQGPAGSLEDMQNAYRADPQVNGLDVVMSREINKAENNLFSPVGGNIQATTQEAYLRELNEFAQKVAADGKSGSRAFWLLTSSYIYYMQGNTADCKKYMDEAAKLKMSNKETELYELIGCLQVLKKNGKITEKTEEDVLPRLKRIEGMAKGNYRYSKVFRDLMHSVVANAYMQQGDTIKAIYAYDRSNKEVFGGYSSADDFMDEAGRYIDNMSTEQLHKVQAFISGKSLSKFEKWLTEETPYSVDALKELEGTRYLRRHDYAKAISILSEVPGKVLDTRMLPNAFMAHTDDWHEEYAEDSTEMYNKLTFAKSMLELEQKIKKAPADAATLFKYATGLYAMTYYGKADNAYTYYRSSSDNDAYYLTDDRKAMPAYQQDFYSATSAEKYFMLAFENSNDKELKAQCLFMAAKCWQKNCPIPPAAKGEYFWGSGNDAYFVNSLRSPYFHQLIEGYKGTGYYEDAYNTCAYLRAYVSRH